jgi:hypothetical protein
VPDFQAALEGGPTEIVGIEGPGLEVGARRPVEDENALMETVKESGAAVMLQETGRRR